MLNTGAASSQSGEGRCAVGHSSAFAPATLQGPGRSWMLLVSCPILRQTYRMSNIYVPGLSVMLGHCRFACRWLHWARAFDSRFSSTKAALGLICFCETPSRALRYGPPGNRPSLSTSLNTADIEGAQAASKQLCTCSRLFAVHV